MRCKYAHYDARANDAPEEKLVQMRKALLEFLKELATPPPT